tara:strand:- start:259 stop:519 length:261 start_codon:yes stop_codon:yes gene_type:complete
MHVNIPNGGNTRNASISAVPVIAGTNLKIEGASCRLYVGIKQDVTLVPLSGEAVTFKNVPAGTTLDLQVVAVKSFTGPKGSIIAMY